ncbi:hypothetical protein IWQ60_007698 [Tieghemiomyces parasiticus]|uniref:Uncharacterized protein n=1 Tax=Tieghemiomyces parasiticus TaxID=78921 RepID=A0A9W7ZVX6_9FUNG|nr:hypothetical protein IWQ60_007698 [Tieghemiomyces parasiticus]
MLFAQRSRLIPQRLTSQLVSRLRTGPTFRHVTPSISNPATRTVATLPRGSIPPGPTLGLRHLSTDSRWRASGLNIDIGDRRLRPFLYTLAAVFVGYVGIVLYNYRQTGESVSMYPRSVRIPLREALVFHKHGSNIDLTRAIISYEKALVELEQYPEYRENPNYLTGILYEYADALAQDQQIDEAVLVYERLLNAWLGPHGRSNPLRVATAWASGKWEQPTAGKAQMTGSVEDVREAVRKAVTVQLHLGDLLERIRQRNSLRIGVWSPNAKPTPLTEYLRRSEEAYEWAVKVCLLAYGQYLREKDPNAVSALPRPAVPLPTTAVKGEEDGSADMEYSALAADAGSIFENMPVVPMDADRLPPWLSYRDLGGALEALALFYAEAGERPRLAFAMLANVIELIGRQDPCHASVLMAHNARILNDHLDNPKNAKHWLEHALDVAEPYLHTNKECAQNCIASWHSYATLLERMGQLEPALRYYRKTLFYATKRKDAAVGYQADQDARRVQKAIDEAAARPNEMTK